MNFLLCVKKLQTNRFTPAKPVASVGQSTSKTGLVRYSSVGIVARQGMQITMPL
jgi:hypothetical protein